MDLHLNKFALHRLFQFKRRIVLGTGTDSYSKKVFVFFDPVWSC